MTSERRTRDGHVQFSGRATLVGKREDAACLRASFRPLRVCCRTAGRAYVM